MEIKSRSFDKKTLHVNQKSPSSRVVVTANAHLLNSLSIATVERYLVILKKSVVQLISSICAEDVASKDT